MTDPFRLQVLKALTSALKEITPTNGYQSNLADFDPGDGVTTARVYRGRLWFGDDGKGGGDPIPMVSILEGVAPGEEVAEAPLVTPHGEYEFPLIVQGFVNDDPLNPTDPAYVLLADVRRRLSIEVKRKTPEQDYDALGLGRGKNRVTGLRIGPGVVRPADEVSAKAYFWLSVVVTIFDNPLEPSA